jgi:hypothetical protein
VDGASGLPVSASFLVIVGCWVAVAYALYVGYGWLAKRQQAERVARQEAAAVASQLLRAGQVIRQPTQQMPRMEVLPSGDPGEASQANAMERNSAPESVEPSAPATGGTIYLCKAYDGGMFWASSVCSNHRALIDRIVSVPPGMPFDQQVQVAQQQRRAAEAVYVAPPPAAGPDPIIAKRAECKALDARVEHLDAQARQPQSGQMQDWIRGERQVARDRQFRIRC